MDRIIDVEQPFRPPALFAPLTAVLREDGDGQEGEQLQNAVKLIQKNNINRRVHQCPNNDVDRLPFEIPAVLIKEERAHHRDARPVGGKGDQTDHGERKHLYPLRETFLAVDRHQNDRPSQGPHHARLIKDAAIRKRKKGYAESEAIGEMGDQGKEEQSAGVFPNAARVPAALGDEKPHDRRRQSADDMKGKHIPHRLSPGEKRPCQVIDRHGDDRDQLDLICIQVFFSQLHLCYPRLII